MPGLSRRSFLTRSAAATGAVAAGWPRAAAGAPPVRLAKCVAMDSLNHGGDLEDLRVNGNLDKLRALGTRWVRLWIRWDKAQLFPPALVPMDDLDGRANDAAVCGTGCGYRYIESIDQQIALARAAGLNVILITWHFPRWANGTAGVAADWSREDRGGPNAPIERLKPLEWRVPAGQLGPRGYYGQWLGWLMDRYAIHGRAFTLEIVNEPNGHLWPQHGPSRTADPYGPGPPVMADYVTEMMATAQALSADRGHPIGLAGPALSDRVRPDDRLFTSVRALVPRTLDELGRRGFPRTPSFAWSHHNYWDIERGVALPGGAGDLARMLRGRWRGRGGPAAPRIWMTEGGARLGSGEVTDLSRQADLVAAAWTRLSALGAVELYSNYLMYSDPVADCGLCDDLARGGAPRPVWGVFQGFPA
jgi:hypothetical protein